VCHQQAVTSKDDSNSEAIFLNTEMYATVRIHKCDANRSNRQHKNTQGNDFQLATLFLKEKNLKSVLQLAMN
jgi:hypothetical protein